MTFDNKGRMIASDQNGALFRIELPPIGADSTVKVNVEKLDIPELQDRVDGPVQIGYAHGLLWAFNSLYVMVNHHAKEGKSRGSGLNRVQELAGDNKVEKKTIIRTLTGEGE